MAKATLEPTYHGSDTIMDRQKLPVMKAAHKDNMNPRVAILADTIETLYGPPMGVISNCLRGCIIPAPGKILYVGDFAAIEGRGLAWLAGADWKLDAYRRGDDLYCTAATSIYGYTVTKKEHPDQRQVGKVAELACGFGGAVGAFQNMGRSLGVIVPDAQARSIVKQWRQANPEIVTYWRDLEQAVIKAVQHRGEATKAGPAGRHVTYLVKGSFLLCRLPSGRVLSYPYPKLVAYVWISKEAVDPETGEVDRVSKRIPDAELPRWERLGWEVNGEPGPGLHYKYSDPQTKRWVEGPTYGASICENVTQAVCRDILAEALFRLEDAGYPVVMHVHDEAVCETDVSFGSKAEFLALMEQVPAWAGDFPIKAEGDRYTRYQK